MEQTTGLVYLIGAGPGDIGLLTLKGAEIIKRADVIVYDPVSYTHLAATGGI